MQFKNMRKIATGLLIGFAISSCNKEPGEGGLASITGKINVEEYNQTYTTLWAEYDGADIDVYIKYGENETYNDRIKTGPTGVFEFTNLLKGDYTVYVYSKDSTLQSPSGNIAIMKEVTITDKKQIVAVPDITIFD